MSKTATRGISLIRTISYSEPNRKEKLTAKVQLKARCNASIPLDHKDFQNQYFSEELIGVKTIQSRPKLKPRKDKPSKFQKAKSKYA